MSRERGERLRSMIRTGGNATNPTNPTNATNGAAPGAQSSARRTG